MTDDVFDWCVRVLEVSAHALGISYKEINVLLFCAIWPAVTLWLALMVVRQRKTIREMRGARLDEIQTFRALLLFAAAACMGNRVEAQNFPTQSFHDAVHAYDDDSVRRADGSLHTFSLTDEGLCAIKLRSIIDTMDGEPKSAIITRLDLSQLSSDIYLRLSPDSSTYYLYAYANIDSSAVITRTARLSGPDDAESDLGQEKESPYVTIPVVSTDSRGHQSRALANLIFRGLSSSIRQCGGGPLNGIGRRNRRVHLERLRADETRKAAYASFKAVEPSIRKDLLARCEATIRKKLRAPVFGTADADWLGSPSNWVVLGDAEATTSYGGRAIYEYACHYRRYNGDWIPASAPVVNEKR